MNDKYWTKGGLTGIFVRAGLRTLQFVLAVIVAGLYGADLGYSTAHHAHGATNWIYAEVVAGLSAITCIIHCLVTIRRVLWCLWDWVLMVLWAAQTGVFGVIYFNHRKNLDNGEVTTSPMRMKIGAWINLINMLLWFATAILGLVWCCSTRRITRRMSIEAPDPPSELSQRPEIHKERSLEPGSNHQNESLELGGKILRDSSLEMSDSNDLEKVETPPPKYNEK
jgi:hypothetical protein